MRLDNESESNRVEDRRGGGGGFPIGGRSIGIGTVVIAFVAAYFFGVDPSVILNGASQSNPSSVSQQRAAPQNAPANDEMTVFVRRVLGNTERTWTQIMRTQFNRDYPAPTLVLFSGGTQTGCGYGQAAMGPFYCPADQKVYIDLSFYQEMRQRFGVAGDFAQAYVIAHEVGHHVQKVLGISDQVDRLRQRLSRADANALSVRVELQADCFAGVWAATAQRNNQQLIEPGDFENGLQAAAAIGDDRLQRQSQGRVVPESFTHGSSEQRQRWLQRGLSTADARQCNTFGAETL
ncbi:KPN_02809 family neutral zinc metallopeptidase [Chitinasiproducens palmae]|uniref:KPN_02809 family neutral zinc metallopeptidase n=1 Tax=Chitinasiproducens palmae TaxID=1770053 RepID=UPI000B85DBBF|nr:neutral zinc metallopeptidase [Chitinasiproducens palmae]